MRIALAQLNPLIGDVDGALRSVLTSLAQAEKQRVDLVLFPEQTLIGYPAKDLLLRRELVARNVAALEKIAANTKSIAALVGFAEPNESPTGRPLFNSAALLSGGRVAATVRKRLLPTYDVFDDVRYFETAGPQPVVEFAGRRLGITICEDLLSDTFRGRSLYDADPVSELVRAGADLIVNISASPFTTEKHAWRVEHLRRQAKRHQTPIVYVNQVGGMDEVLFDGASCVMDADGQIVAQAKSFAEDLLIVDLDDPSQARVEASPSFPADLHAALLMGLRDYVRKCGFSSVVVGLSGGIDSAVVAALAAEALGPEHVHGVAMPSRYSSAHSLSDARALSRNLGIKLSVIEIETVHAALEKLLTPHFADRPADVTEENIQARARGVILMALSNKFGSLLLTTGNKSELAVGYCTLYGDMCGGLAVISDVAKTHVYALARRMNEAAGCELIPRSTLEKAPSAELRPGQTDQDSLPAYDELDAILDGYVEQLLTRDELIANGHAAEVVDDVLRRVRASEYKRQQAAPGLKVTSRAFGFGRRIPIAARTAP